MSAAYRVRQFIRAAGAWIQPEDTGDDPAVQFLSPEALSLFRTMPGYDRQHALGVLRTLQEQGYTDQDLLTAALLHDVGKTVHQAGALRLWHRVAVVLMRALWPDLLEQLGQAESGSWRRPFFVHQHHAAIGAELARQAGCSPEAVALIRHHEDPPDQVEEPLLAALQAADGVN